MFRHDGADVDNSLSRDSKFSEQILDQLRRVIHLFDGVGHALQPKVPVLGQNIEVTVHFGEVDTAKSLRISSR